MKTNLTPEYIQKIWDNKRVRQRLAFESPFWFSMLYLRHHFDYPLAPFHIEMFHIIQSPQYDFVAMMAFRGSGKSTIMNMANVLWSVLGKPKKKFVVIMSKSQEQAKNHFSNIKTEFETNELLIEDFGPFKESHEEWRKLSLELVYRDSKIISVARDQSIRGLKYGSFRPDLIICDDFEDISDKNNSDHIYEQFAHEILPLGNANTRIVVLGNLIDKNSLMIRLKDYIETKSESIFRAYPIIDSHEKVLWPQRFPNKKSLQEFEIRIQNATWVREYLLDAIKDVSYNESGGSPRLDKCMLLAKPYWKPIRDAELKYRKALEKTGKITYQKPIIKQMGKFSIDAPIIKSYEVNNWEPISDSDPQYVKEYKVESKKAWDDVSHVVNECLKKELCKKPS